MNTETTIEKSFDSNYPISKNNPPKATSSDSSDSFDQPNEQQPLVVIIGAGLAGLSSANKLIELGHNNLIILESTNRVGGRIESFEFFDGCSVDLGAQWLHGEKENPVFNWLKDDLNLIDSIEEEEVEFEGLFRLYCFEEFKNLNESKLNEIVFKCLEILLDARHILYQMSTNLKLNCKPIEIYRKHFWLECSRDNYLKEIDKNLLKLILNWFELYETIDNSCENLAKLSIKAYSEWTDFDNGKMVKLKAGWSSVVNKLLDSINRNRIKLNCSVEKIQHSINGIKIEYNKGKILNCEHCIVTIPLGALKLLLNENKFFFTPPLEEERIELIKKSGIDVVNKIFLLFEEPFLQEEKGLKLLWPSSYDDQDQIQIKDSYSISVEEKSQNRIDKLPNWVKCLTGFDLVDGHNNILLGWIGGIGAKEIESYSEEEIRFVCSEILKIFLPNKRIPKLIKIKCSSWGKNKNFNGSYSYHSVETVNLDTNNLWKPIYWLVNNNKQQQQQQQVLMPRIQFAGEATALSMYATAHGAIISGWREAERLKKYL